MAVCASDGRNVDRGGPTGISHVADPGRPDAVGQEGGPTTHGTSVMGTDQTVPGGGRRDFVLWRPAFTRLRI
jgi:hypothetical protein